MVINDFILNQSGNLLNTNVTTAFKIYFHKNIKKYFLAPGGDGTENESIIFIKLEKKFVNFLLLFDNIRKLQKKI